QDHRDVLGRIEVLLYQLGERGRRRLLFVKDTGHHIPLARSVYRHATRLLAPESPCRSDASGAVAARAARLHTIAQSAPPRYPQSGRVIRRARRPQFAESMGFQPGGAIMDRRNFVKSTAACVAAAS